MRHAKAEPFAATDEDRVLTESGRRAALEAGRRLAEIDAVPDHALLSPAARSRGTWEAVVEGSASTAEAAFDDAVYSGSPGLLLESLRALPESARTPIVIGHNPAVSYLAHLLDDGEGEPTAIEHMLRGYPPGALTVFDVAVAWAELDEAGGRVLAFHVGRG